jgi:hypothetical protein
MRLLATPANGWQDQGADAENWRRPGHFRPPSFSLRFEPQPISFLSHEWSWGPSLELVTEAHLPERLLWSDESARASIAGGAMQSHGKERGGV